MKHTQGKWKAHKQCDHYLIGVDPLYDENFDEKKVLIGLNTIASIDYGNESAANAKLIAAAPEMLEALIEATSIFDNYPETQELVGTIEVINNAIKKATS